MASSSVGRYYDPSTGQFLSVDPDVAVTNQAYLYAGDNPGNGVDPLGLSWWNPTTWTAKTWDDIATGASAVALIPIPGIDVVAGALAATAGSVAAVKNAEAGNWEAAGLDVIAVGLGGVGVRSALEAGADSQAAEAALKDSAYMSPWFKADAESEESLSRTTSRLALGAGGIGYALSSLGVEPGSRASTSVGPVCFLSNTPVRFQ